MIGLCWHTLGLTLIKTRIILELLMAVGPFFNRAKCDADMRIHANDANILIMNKLTTYLKEVRVELGKVNWPSREQTTQYTLLVIGVSFAIAVFLIVLAYIFSWLLNKLIL